MAATKKPTDPVEAVEEITPTDPMKDMVEVELFQDGGAYKAPVYVSVNGMEILIPRGKKTKIPRPHYEVLVASRKQEIAVSNMLKELEDKTDARMDGLGQTLTGVKPKAPDGDIKL